MNKRIFDIKKKVDGKSLQKSVVKEFTKKQPTTQDFVRRMRLINEQENDERKNLKTVYDQTREEKNFRKNIDDLNVTVDFIPLEVYDDFVFWGGTIDGTIQFVYKVTPDEDTSGVEFNYLEDFNPENEDNEEIIERIENYYDQFYKYWRNNILQT
jgi:hypothetical protein